MYSIITIIGIIGTVCLALSGVPQAIKSYIEGHSNGLAHWTIWLWLIGECAMLIYSIFLYQEDYILLTNYFANCVIVSVMCKYKYFPKNKDIPK